MSIDQQINNFQTIALHALKLLALKTKSTMIEEVIEGKREAYLYLYFTENQVKVWIYLDELEFDDGLSDESYEIIDFDSEEEMISKFIADLEVRIKNQ